MIANEEEILKGGNYIDIPFFIPGELMSTPEEIDTIPLIDEDDFGCMSCMSCYDDDDDDDEFENYICTKRRERDGKCKKGCKRMCRGSFKGKLRRGCKKICRGSKGKKPKDWKDYCENYAAGYIVKGNSCVREGEESETEKLALGKCLDNVQGTSLSKLKKQKSCHLTIEGAEAVPEELENKITIAQRNKDIDDAIASGEPPPPPITEADLTPAPARIEEPEDDKKDNTMLFVIGGGVLVAAIIGVVIMTRKK